MAMCILSAVLCAVTLEFAAVAGDRDRKAVKRIVDRTIKERHVETTVRPYNVYD